MTWELFPRVSIASLEAHNLLYCQVTPSVSKQDTFVEMQTHEHAELNVVFVSCIELCI
jgi:hypothetical protein